MFRIREKETATWIQPVWERLIKIITRGQAGTATKSHASILKPLTQHKWSRKTLEIGSKRFADGVDATTRNKLDQLKENFHHVETWKQYEILELLIQGVDLAHVTIPWLDQFREDLDLKV